MRKRFLYLRLAVSNLWKNRQTYLSFFLSTMCTIFVFYTFTMIAMNEGLKKLPGAQGMMVMMVLGAIVVAIFSFIFLFYANSFLIKRRKKELGLYAILGLEKKHIARILFHENVILLILSLLCGIGLGIALSKLMFLIIQALMRVSTVLVFELTPLPLILTAALFAAVFLFLLQYNRLQVHLTNPVNMLKGNQKGEKEPKTRWLLALIGAAAMGAGYVLANTVGNPLQALTTFFVAVILVIVGTYALFTAGSIALLKILRRNKGYYYKSRNFISVSGMIYRMKQNAAGLAGICILSTMAIITIGTTAALYIGQESMLKSQYPLDHKIHYEEGTFDSEWVSQVIQNNANKYNVTVPALYESTYLHTVVYKDANMLSAAEQIEITESNNYENIWGLYILTVGDYNRMADTSQTLADNQCLLYKSRNIPAPNTITIGNLSLAVTDLTEFPIARKSNNAIDSPLYLIVKDQETAKAVFAGINGIDAEYQVFQGFWWNSQGEEKALIDYSNDVLQTLRANGKGFSSSSAHIVRQEWFGTYGGFLFLGVFLGLLFLMATTLIIYFKQVSEGYMDHDRFIILQKVGMGRDEVKATVRKQILMVFILPIVAAVIHTWGALHMMTSMLAMFGLGDKLLIAASIFITAGVFALLYFFVYSATARTYYTMVKMEQ